MPSLINEKSDSKVQKKIVPRIFFLFKYGTNVYQDFSLASRFHGP